MKNTRNLSTAWLLITLFCLIGPSVQAQTFGSTVGKTGRANADHQYAMMRKIIKGVIDPTTEEGNPNVEGTPYLHEEFKPAILYYPKLDPLQAKVRYNIAQEKIQVIVPDKGYAFLHPGVSVKLNDELFKMYSFIGEDKSVKLIGYFSILTNDYKNKDLLLLKKYKKVVEPGKPASEFRPKSLPEFDNDIKYFLKFADSNFATLIEKGRNDFVELFPEEQQDQVEDFMKKENLKPRQKKDLIKIVAFYNDNF